MKKGSTVFLRLVVIGFGLLVLALCVLVFPAIYREWALQYPNIAPVRYVVLVGLAASAVCFFLALQQTLLLLNFIDKNTAFSDMSVRAIGKIKQCGMVIGVLYTAALPLVYYMADQDDAPGLMLLGLIITSVAFVVATFAAVLQKLLKSAIALKSESDLTV